MRAAPVHGLGAGLKGKEQTALPRVSSFCLDWDVNVVISVELQPLQVLHSRTVGLELKLKQTLHPLLHFPAYSVMVTENEL